MSEASREPPMPLRLTYDATVDVAYLALRPTGPNDVLGPTLLLENDRAFGGAVAADFALADGRLVGLEFQMASACLPRGGRPGDAGEPTTTSRPGSGVPLIQPGRPGRAATGR